VADATAHEDVAARLPDDPVDRREGQAGALALPLDLGERLEEVRLCLGVERRAGVRDRQAGVRAG
jgi:hypothetical protein